MATVDRNISHYLAAPLIASIRVFYSGSASWMIVASALGHGGYFTTFMNWKIFVHLNKLSYAIYLLNPMVISFIFGLTDHSTHFEPITQVRFFFEKIQPNGVNYKFVFQVVTTIGIMVIVYILAFGFSLLFEVPYTKLSNELLNRRKEKVT